MTSVTSQAAKNATVDVTATRAIASVGLRKTSKVSSLPSHEAYVVDVPEAHALRAEFRYNYFVPDEGVSESGGTPRSFVTMPGESFDAGVIDMIRTRVPRLVELNFTPPAQTALIVTEDVVRDSNTPRKKVIATNLARITSEDEFAAGRFTALLFQNGSLDEMTHDLVSGSLSQLAPNEFADGSSHYRAALDLSNIVRDVDRDFLTSNMTNAAAQGVAFHEQGSRVRRDGVTVGLQVGSKFAHDLVQRASLDHDNSFARDMQGAIDVSKRAQQLARASANPTVADSDYGSRVQFIDVSAIGTELAPVPRPAKIVGYVIECYETGKDGSITMRDPIVIEDPTVSRTVDVTVRYGATYTYTVRTIAQFTFPAIDDDTGNVVLATTLVSSRPSNEASVRCVEFLAPPPPADIGFSWDYDADRLVIHWAFPVNPQRDVKRFQVFRRSSILEPFELIKVYDFDDSVAKIPQRERPAAACVEVLTNPKTSFVDEDFGRLSRFIYALGSVDAHGNVSPYSAQFEVRFDQFRNRLLTAIVSHVGAPKQYPNMYLEADTFVDTIRDRGHRKLNIYFTPECYSLRDGLDREVPAVLTDRDDGAYRLQFINPDAQGSSHVDIRIIDSRTITAVHDR